jgi:FkbM family methyltransferase
MIAKFTIRATDRTIEFFSFATHMSRAICKEILAGRTYPRIPFVHDVQTVLDIGANVGAAAVYFALQHPSATIFALEPAAEPFRLLVRNAKSFSNVRTFNFGLFDDDKSVPLHRGKFDSVTASIGTSTLNSSQTEVVNLRRADTWLAQVGISRIDLLKIDTEGCEVPILRSMESLIPGIKVIYLEYHSEDDRQFLDHLVTPSHILYAGRASHPHRGELCYVARSAFPSPEELDRHKIGVSA